METWGRATGIHAICMVDIVLVSNGLYQRMRDLEIELWVGDACRTSVPYFVVRDTPVPRPIAKIFLGLNCPSNLVIDSTSLKPSELHLSSSPSTVTPLDLDDSIT